jgi:PAS domain S-box-containing protein
VDTDEDVLLRVQRRVLELIAEGHPLGDVLATLCLAIEQVVEGTHCSILMLGADGLRVRHVAGPSLPPAYCRAIDGAAIGPAAGSCGTAMYRAERVVVEDIASDPLWADYRAVALPFGLLACASVPIVAGAGRKVLGSFAIYHLESGPFSPRELSLLESLTDLAAVTIVNYRRELALRESEHQRSRTEAFSLVMVTHLSLGGAWLKVPPTLCELLGRSETELLSSTVAAHTHPEDVAREELELARLARGDTRSFDLEKRFVSASGKVIWAYVNTSVVYDDADRPAYLLMYVRDLTEHKQSEEMLRRMQKAESLAVLAGGIAHDFNNLLAAVAAHASLLGVRLQADEDALSSVRNIEQLVQQAASFTQQLLAYTGKARVEVRDRDINDLVSSIVHLLGVSVSKNTTLRFELTPGLPNIEADAAQLSQVVLNLITNASEAIGNSAGEIVVRTRREELDEAQVALRFPGEQIRPGEYVVLEVSDTGVGMSAETQARIFEPFFTTKFSGRGLGLAATLGIIKGHHGGVELKSTVGEGSCFSLFFPAMGGKKRSHRPAHEEHAAHARPLRVLLVDDEEGVRNAMQQLLEYLGHQVLVASDGHQALSLLEQKAASIELVIMDVTMPGLDGIETAKRIHARWPHIPIVLSSGYAEPDRRVKGIKFLQKPYKLDTLERVLSDVLGPRAAKQN